MVATSNAGAGDAVAVGVGDDGAAGAGAVCASSAGHTRTIDAAVRRKDFREKFRAGAKRIFITRRILHVDSADA